MKNIFKILIALAILFGLFTYRAQINQELSPVVNNVRGYISGFLSGAPCSEPIPYTLQNFDTKFGISQDYFLGALADAEDIWEKASGKDLFVYEKTAQSSHDLKVNLVYDYRQEATSKLSSLGIVVKDNQASYDSLRAKWQAEKADYTKIKDDFTALVNNFNAKQKAFEVDVEYWNTKGGAPKAEYQKLQAQRAALEAESNTLQTTQNEINSMIEEINALATELNRLAGVLNISVDKYNDVTEARGESFEEGVYSSDGINREIDIYEFSSRAKLVRVLAHELGHALGLDHVEDGKAIMYKLNQGNSQALTEADIDALNTKCASK